MKLSTINTIALLTIANILAYTYLSLATFKIILITSIILFFIAPILYILAILLYILFISFIIGTGMGLSNKEIITVIKQTIKKE